MPTKNGALSIFHKDVDNPMNLHPEQCTFILPSGNITIGIRPMHPDTDTPIIYHWISQEYAGGLEESNLPPQGLEEAYASMLDSDFVRPFMGLVNDVPVCQLEICKTSKDILSLHYEAGPDDFGLRLLLAPLVNQDHILLLLRMWLKHLFAFDEIDRIVVDVESGNEWLTVLFIKAGFRFSRKIQLPYKAADLYICTRSEYQ